jgi:hypothetical protein
VVSLVLKFLDNVMKGLMTGLMVFVSSFLSMLVLHANLPLLGLPWFLLIFPSKFGL